MKYNPVSRFIVSKLEEICGENNVITEREKLEPYSHDETPTEKFSHFPEVVVRPGKTEQVAKIVKLA